MASGDEACGDEWSYGGGDRRRRARAEGWETSGGGGGSTYRGDDGSGSDDDNSRPLQKRPRGPGNLLQRIHFVPAGYAGLSREHGRSLYTRSSYPVPKAVSFPETVANMMKLMNYKVGSGLGKHGQGITTPIMVTAWPGHSGLGTVKGSYDNGLPTADKWTKNWGDAGGGNESYYYLRFDERERGDDDGSRKHGQEFCEEILAKMGERRAAAAVSTKTPQRRSGTVKGNPFLVREEGALDDGEDMADAVAVITKALTLVQEESSSGKLTAGDLIYEFTRLKEKFPEEYMTYCLADTAGTLVAPLLRPVFQRWKPLWDPTLWLDVANLLKNVLEDDASSDMSPYAVLINEMVVPAVQASEWKATEPGSLTRFLETWKDTLPPSTVQRILQQVVMPELASVVELWDPRCSWEIKCHVWFCPWVPLLGPLPESLCATAKLKLEAALSEWDASHAWVSNYKMASPWKYVFDPASWEEFVERNVVPNMRQGLQMLQITPPKQRDGTFRQMMEWAPLVRPGDMVRALLEAGFFCRWLHALRHWLRAATPTAREAIEWCRGWKRLFTPELLADERVLAPLDAGIDMVNRAAQGLEIQWPA